MKKQGCNKNITGIITARIIRKLEFKDTVRY